MCRPPLRAQVFGAFAWILTFVRMTIAQDQAATASTTESRVGVGTTLWSQKPVFSNIAPYSDALRSRPHLASSCPVCEEPLL